MENDGLKNMLGIMQITKSDLYLTQKTNFNLHFGKVQHSYLQKNTHTKKNSGVSKAQFSCDTGSIVYSPFSYFKIILILESK